MENAESNLQPVPRLETVSERLSYLIKQHFRSRYAFERHTGLGHTTVAGWFGARPKLPQFDSLSVMVEMCGWSADFILFGRGPEHIAARVGTGELLSEWRAMLCSRVATTCEVTLEFVDAVLPGGEELLLTTVDICKPLVEEYLSRYREFEARKTERGRRLYPLAPPSRDLSTMLGGYASDEERDRHLNEDVAMAELPRPWPRQLGLLRIPQKRPASNDESSEQ